MTQPTLHLSHPKYRPDIDGLRAVAVLAVVIFHAFPTALKGGFIGVDIFFVISGYLISTIIFESLDRGAFSFTEFYARRIKRIFPALLLVLVACYGLGWLTLLDDELRQLGKHIAGGAGFVSNLMLWNEVGYFDNSVETKPLLHLWSLGVEEQFYIVWPVLLWMAWRFRFNVLALTVILAAVSFLLSVKGVKHDAIATFYSPHTRFWELLAGTLLAWFSLYRQRVVRTRLAQVLSLLGLCLLVFGFLRINKGLNFPGKWALVPVLGAVLIIAAGPDAWFNRRVLSNKLAVWFGLISFPLYLWHWPLLSFARIVEGEVPTVGVRVAAVLLAILLAWLTFRLVELPLRSRWQGRSKVIVLVLLAVGCGATGYVTYIQDSIAQRTHNQKLMAYQNSIKVTDRAAECFEIPYAYKTPDGWFCGLGERETPVEYFAYGDSHALSLVPALEKFARDHKVGMKFTGTSGCPSLLGIQSLRGEARIEKYNCQALNERIFNDVQASGIKHVILINRWTYYTSSPSRPSEFNGIARDPSAKATVQGSTNDLVWAMDHTVSRYAQIGVNVIFIEDNPQQRYEPKDVLRRGRGIEREYLKLSVSREEHVRNQAFVNAALRKTSATIINFDNVLCPGDICPLVEGNEFLYSDDDHLSITGALKVYPALAEGLTRSAQTAELAK
ncbi:acyltransferase family protein [Pseudomonas aegrilactucae]|uniref:Acyltransferase n=1 Tax=Pseudomonas aegrilactucae TaxID=2854028 RepID=A0A9Q2XQX2_9PSED|nr:acyltransferase family protein [Pseudomonas aegrilactucae]MBV6290410.1 acyltransferase [Pseudomonas aegrilactucae]